MDSPNMLTAIDADGGLPVSIPVVHILLKATLVEEL